MKCTTRKILNNNVVLVNNVYGKEMILIGDGIGFHSKIGTTFTQTQKVKQIFMLKESKNKNSFREILENINEKLVAVVEEELAKIQSEYQEKLNENIHITLIDHIAFAIKRHQKGIDFRYPFNSELKILYEKEYQAAETLVERINETFHVDLAEDEKGLIAIHIHAAVKDEQIEVARRKTIFIQEMISRIYEEFDLEIHKDSLAYQRMLVHVKFAVERIWAKQTIDNNLTEYIRENYRSYFERIKKVLEKISEEYEEFEVPDSEISYLTIHFIRIIEDEQ